MQPPFHSETLVPGDKLSFVLRRHRSLRITALTDHANLSALFYNAAQPLDRLNLPDTLKALHTAKLTRGHVLMSDMGHALASITYDTCGWHDPLCGHTTADSSLSCYGERTYQTARNDCIKNGRDNFLIELAKHGLGERDLCANVNFFSKVTVDDAGHLQFHVSHSKQGQSIELRAEMDTLVVLSATPHPMDPSPNYAPGSFCCERLQTPPPAADDFCRNFRPECARALQLSELFHL